MTHIEALKLALEVAKIRWDTPSIECSYVDKMVIDACEKALAQPIKLEPNDSFERDEAARARVREFMRNH